MTNKLTDDEKREKRNARSRYNTAAKTTRRVAESLTKAIDTVLEQPGKITHEQKLKEIKSAAENLLALLPDAEPMLTEEIWRNLEAIFNLPPSPFPG